MGDTFKQFSVGDKPQFAASQVNAWTAAARVHQQAVRPLQGGSPQQLDVNRVPVSNESGTDLPPFSVLQLTGPAIDPAVDENEFLNRIAFAGGTVSENDTGKIAIIQQFLPENVIDPSAIVSGLTFARLTGDAGQTNATSKSGQSTLEAGSSGPCVILYDPGPSGVERTACVKIGGGSGGKCPQWWFLQLFPGAGGIASSGSFSLDYDAEDKDGNSVTGSITVPYDSSLADFQTLLEADANLMDIDSALVVSLKGGPLHRVALAIGNNNATGQRITELDWSSSTLDSGQPYIIPWRPA